MTTATDTSEMTRELARCRVLVDRRIEALDGARTDRLHAARAASAAGLTDADIAATLGISSAMVWKLLRKGAS
jgi:DNA-binding transcriptional regulator LsrR (DeoR family)